MSMSNCLSSVAVCAICSADYYMGARSLLTQSSSTTECVQSLCMKYLGQNRAACINQTHERTTIEQYNCIGLAHQLATEFILDNISRVIHYTRVSVPRTRHQLIHVIARYIHRSKSKQPTINRHLPKLAVRRAHLKCACIKTRACLYTVYAKTLTCEIMCAHNPRPVCDPP